MPDLGRTRLFGALSRAAPLLVKLGTWLFPAISLSCAAKPTASCTSVGLVMHRAASSTRYPYLDKEIQDAGR